MADYPSYLRLYDSGELDERTRSLAQLEVECRLCPRRCGVKRFEGEKGVCGTDSTLMVSSAFPHFGEEPPLTGVSGSGAVFLTHCNLKCVFCQNYDISHGGEGTQVTPEELARIMVNLQSRGCHNINFVTPTHYAPQIVSAVALAVPMGLQLPIVWNCGGYESLEAVKLLDGIVDIYMPDMKYSSETSAKKYSAALDYWPVVKEAVREMARQVGPLSIDRRGVARRGLLVRHLVMPNDVCGSEEIFRFIAEEISKDTYVNIMDQYRPMHRAFRHGEISRPVSVVEYERAVSAARRHGLNRGF